MKRKALRITKKTKMLNSFDAILAEARRLPPGKIVVAGAEEEEAVISLVDARREGLADGILVGNRDLINSHLARNGQKSSDWDIRDAGIREEIAFTAIRCLLKGEARSLMKGRLKTGELMKAILDRERGLSPRRLLSHLFIFEPPSLGRILILSDGGMVPKPDLSQKKEIIHNAVAAALALGDPRPRTAILSAFNHPHECLPASLDAAVIAGLNREEGWLSEAVIEGPLTLDEALEREATIFIVPDIESGNFMGKSIVYHSGARAGLVIMGADFPLIVTSRVDNARTRLNSIALALLIQQRMETFHASRH
jgi:phosphate butyryltransferase